MKIKFLIFAIIFIFSASFSFAASCKYKWKIDQCTSAIKSFSWKDNMKYIWLWGRLKDFEDFPCIQDSAEARAFQIAMDENFKKIDKDAEKYLKDLYGGKNYYFWKWSSSDFFDWVKDIFQKKDDLKRMYDEACIKSFNEAKDCVDDISSSEPKIATSVLDSIDFLNWWQWSWACFLLSKAKTDIFLEVAHNWLLLNRQQVSKDQHKEYVQHQRDKNGKLLQAMRVNWSYLEKLSYKWTSKTKHTINSR